MPSPQQVLSFQGYYHFLKTWVEGERYCNPLSKAPFPTFPQWILRAVYPFLALTCLHVCANYTYFLLVFLPVQESQMPDSWPVRETLKSLQTQKSVYSSRLPLTFAHRTIYIFITFTLATLEATQGLPPNSPKTVFPNKIGASLCQEGLSIAHFTTTLQPKIQK